MTSEKAFKVFTAAIFCVILLTSLAQGASVDKKAPSFKVTSGKDEILTLDMLKGKMAVIFYETRDTKEKNRALKEALNTFYASLSPETQKDISRVAVIRCSAFMPAVWRRNLRENSKKEGIIIYGDWDGSMEKNYDMTVGESNFLIIDKSGIIRYARAGAIQKEDFPIIEKIINGL